MARANRLFESLMALYDTLRESMKQRWRRDLPFDELLFDRWQRAATLGFGEGTSIYHNSYVYGNVAVGKNTWIGPYTLLDGSGGLTIGNHCNISAGVQIYTHDTVKRTVSGGRAETERAPVSIGNYCYIGSQTVIAKGVSIGDHCVVGACSFVNQDLPPGVVAFGVPCKPRGHVKIDESGNVNLVI